MFSTKQLSDEQISTIKQWAQEGARMADIQKRIKDEMNFPLTYMETRLVVLDLGITLLEEKTTSPIPEITTKSLPTGKTTVTLDTVARPGAILSGLVTFSDGESAEWMLDQMGRPSLNPDTAGYHPNQEDIIAFQQELRSIIEKQGF